MLGPLVVSFKHVRLPKNLLELVIPLHPLVFLILVLFTKSFVMVSPKLLAALAALSLAVSVEAGVCRPKATTTLSITSSDGATATTSASTETVSVTSSETSVVSSETSISADTSESTTDTASTTAESSTSVTVDLTSTTEGTTTTAETSSTTVDSATSTTVDTASTTESTTSTAQDTTTTTEPASTTTEDASSTAEGTTTTTDAASTTTTKGPLAPTVTAKVTLKAPPTFAFTLFFKDQNNYLYVNFAEGDTFAFIREGGIATKTPNSSKKLVLYNPGPDKAIIRLMDAATAAAVPHVDIICSLADDDAVSCEAPSVGYTNLYLCGSLIYLGVPGNTDPFCYALDGHVRMASS